MRRLGVTKKNTEKTGTQCVLGGALTFCVRRIEEKRKQDFTLVFYQTSVEEKGVDFIREIKNHVYDKRQMSG